MLNSTFTIRIFLLAMLLLISSITHTKMLDFVGCYAQGRVTGLIYSNGTTTALLAGLLIRMEDYAGRRL